MEGRVGGTTHGLRLHDVTGSVAGSLTAAAAQAPAMRGLLLCLLLAPCHIAGLAAATGESVLLTISDPPGTSIAIWNGMLVVTAPAGGRPDLARLRQPIDVAWDDATIDQVAEFLRQRTDLNLVVVPPTGERRVTLKATAMPLGRVLGWIERLSGASLSAIDGAIAFGETPAQGTPVTRLYEVRDLLPLVSSSTDPREQEADLTALVQRTVKTRMVGSEAR